MVPIFGHFFPLKSCLIKFVKIRFRQHFGRFFTKASGHPDDHPEKNKNGSAIERAFCNLRVVHFAMHVSCQRMSL
jgi:hypothetical protein